MSCQGPIVYQDGAGWYSMGKAWDVGVIGSRIAGSDPSGRPVDGGRNGRQLAVTGTAVRNRLSRLLATGLVERGPSTGTGSSKTPLSGQRRGPQAAGAELRRPGRGALGGDDEHRRGSKTAPPAVHPDHRSPCGGLSYQGDRSGVGRTSGPAQQHPARSRSRGGSRQGRAVWISSFASTPAPTMNSPRPTLPSALSSARCSRRSSAAVYGSASAGSTEIARATSRPSRRPSLQRNRVMPVRYDDRDPDDEPDPLGRWRKGRDSEYWPSILRSASNSRHGGITL